MHLLRANLSDRSFLPLKSFLGEAKLSIRLVSKFSCRLCLELNFWSALIQIDGKLSEYEFRLLLGENKPELVIALKLCWLISCCRILWYRLLALTPPIKAWLAPLIMQRFTSN